MQQQSFTNILLKFWTRDKASVKHYK